MFKKSLLATALMVAAFNSSAAVNAIAGVNVSQEGSAGAANITVPNSVVTLAAEYTVGDTVTFTVSGASFDTVGSTPVLTAALGGGDTATTGLLSSTASAVTFRITAQTDGTVPNNGVIFTGGTFTLSGMKLTTASTIDAVGDITVTYSASTSTGITIDSAATNADVAATVVAQFSSSVTIPANGIIDVNNDRQQFTVGPTTDTIELTPAEAVAAVNDAAYTGATHVIHGDFSWMDTDANSAVSGAELTAAFGMAGAGDDTFANTINAAMDTITVVATDGGANAVEAHTATFTVAGVGAGNAVIPTQTFTVDTTVAYNTAALAAASKVTATAAAAGSWTLNGSKVTIPYMPFGDDTAVILRGTNTGTQSGAMSVRYMLEGVDTTWKSLSGSVTTLAPGVTNLTALVMDAIKWDAGVTKGKVAIEITTNVPASALTFYAAYKVKSEMDRGFVGTFGFLGTNKN